MKKWRDRNLTGLYHMVEIVNDRPVYKVSFILDKKDVQQQSLYFKSKRNEKNEDGVEIYLWYHREVLALENLTNIMDHSWRLTTDSDFKARNTRAYMYITSRRKQELFKSLLKS